MNLNFEFFKLEVFVPRTHFEPVRKALYEADAGHIGGYDCVLSYSDVTGTWRPLSGTKPFIGREGEVSEEPEIKIEVTVRAARLGDTIAAIKHVHPYEEPLINVLPLFMTGQTAPNENAN